MDTNKNCTATFKTGSTSNTVSLTVTAPTNGTIKSNPGIINCGLQGTVCTDSSFVEGSQVTLTATPVTGGKFLSWTGDCSTGTTDSVTLTMDAAKTCSATFEGAATNQSNLVVTVTGAGKVARIPAGSTCATGTDCTSYPTGDEVALSARADAGAEFDSWGGDCAGQTGSLILTKMDTNKNCTATFKTGSTTQKLTVSLSGAGKGTVKSDVTGIDCGTDCTEDYPKGNPVSLTATPDASSSFTGWTGDCASATGNTAAVTMDADKNCTATFAATPTPTKAELKVTASGNGTVSKSPAGEACAIPSTSCSAYTTGTSVTLTANSLATDTTFTGWSGDCSSAGTANPAVMTMDVAKNCGATFTTSSTPPPVGSYQLTVTTSGSGTVISDSGGINCGTACTSSYTSGTMVRLTATPSAGATFTSWGGSCTGTSTATVVSMDAAKNCTATFSGSGGSTGGDPNVTSCFNQQDGVYAGNACLKADGLLSGAVDTNGNGVNVTVSMKGGISNSGGPYLKESTVVLADPIATRGVIQVDPADVGQKVDLIVAGIHYSNLYSRGFEWYMLEGCNVCVKVWPYNDRDAAPILAELKALKTVDSLAAIQVVDMYSGNFVFPGLLDIFYGYRVVSSGKLVFNLSPIRVTINP
jgi:hypothetical protein